MGHWARLFDTPKPRNNPATPVPVSQSVPQRWSQLHNTFLLMHPASRPGSQTTIGKIQSMEL
ncbi:hypothetical protein NQZ68_022942 [Dissostichus eleginoides]|nr:hypothetical protein NQZ68_022942 [Dissostichus eleginoides]